MDFWGEMIRDWGIFCIFAVENVRNGADETDGKAENVRRESGRFTGSPQERNGKNFARGKPAEQKLRERPSRGARRKIS